MKFRYLTLALLLSFSSLFAASKCGFAQLMDQKQKAKHGLARKLLRQGTCLESALYDSVFVDTTRHFRIFYTKTGPHAVTSSSAVEDKTPPFIDTLAHWLEEAYILHTQQIGMKTPKGPVQSMHYLDSRFPDKYPVEVIDIGLLRDTWDPVYGFGGPCEGCYGLTLPASKDHSQSELLIDNDFFYQRANDPLTTWSLENGQICTYTKSNRPITTYQNEQLVDYTVDWHIALKVTAFHELYHACQLRYQDYNVQYHFWFEASATGVEDLGAPEINDYFQYLDILFNSPQISLFDYTHDNQLRPYGQAIFYQYLLFRFGLSFDPEIWTLLEQSPSTPLSKHLETFAKSHGETDFTSLHHDFAIHLLSSGDHAEKLPADSIWNPDLPLWPTLNPIPFQLSALPTDSFAFRVFDASTGAVDYTPTAASGLRKSIVTISAANYVLISSGRDPNTQGENLKNLASLAFPNPWRGTSDLCFQLSGKSTEIEIRDAQGYITVRLPHDTLTTKTCFDGRTNNKPLAPGLYYWRGNRESSLHRFLVVR